MVWGLNLGLNNATNAVNMVKSIMRAFADQEVIASGVSLERIEVGAPSNLPVPTRPRLTTRIQATKRTNTA